MEIDWTAIGVAGVGSIGSVLASIYGSEERREQIPPVIVQAPPEPNRADVQDGSGESFAARWLPTVGMAAGVAVLGIVAVLAVRGK